jgi:hypothetical protein
MGYFLKNWAFFKNIHGHHELVSPQTLDFITLLITNTETLEVNFQFY